MQTKQSDSHCLAVFVLLLGLSGCHGDASGLSDNGSSSYVLSYSNGLATVTSNTLVLTMDSGIGFTSVTSSRTGQPMRVTQSINGLSFKLEQDSLTLGKHVFGGLQDGDVLRLAEDGIFVNGKRRWDMPTE
ncbi:MAG: hypothetical protein ACI8QS_001880 [Planctomycetota bacterium]|jgi:hypothetical protein